MARKIARSDNPMALMMDSLEDLMYEEIERIVERRMRRRGCGRGDHDSDSDDDDHHRRERHVGRDRDDDHGEPMDMPPFDYYWGQVSDQFGGMNR